ncbi:MAG TPA: urease subunit gamma [Acidimicrobiales bacterium]|nr:urease subunit gamma [Acidimicrobiales bacterium]
MRLTPRETERLTIFTLAELARRRRARGRLLSVPEATALICDEMLEASWDGTSLDEVVAIGKQVLSEDDVMDGVRALLVRIEVECLFPSGTCLVVVDDPIAPGCRSGTPLDAQPSTPGAISSGEGSVALNAGRRTVEVEVRNESDRAVFISSHYPFSQVNDVLQFERKETVGMRLDVPAGASIVFPAHARRTVRLVEFGGARVEPALQIRRGDEGALRGAHHDG